MTKLIFSLLLKNKMKKFKLKKEKFDGYRKTQIPFVSWKNKSMKFNFFKNL